MKILVQLMERLRRLRKKRSISNRKQVVGGRVTAQLYTKNEKEKKRWEWWNTVIVTVLQVDHSNRQSSPERREERGSAL